jgi:hypothetical protein
VGERCQFIFVSCVSEFCGLSENVCKQTSFFGLYRNNFSLVGLAEHWDSRATTIYVLILLRLSINEDMHSQLNSVDPAVPTSRLSPEDERRDLTHTRSQLYLSTRGGEYGVR